MTQLGFFGEPDDTLARERARLLAQRRQTGGTICGACDQRVKEYRRIVGASQASALIRLFLAAPDGEWRHVDHLGLTTNQRGDFAKLRFWGLIEERPKDDEDTTTRTSGLWRIEEKGRAFVNGRRNIRPYCWMYDGEPTEWAPESDWSIRDALGKKFDYEELMRGTG